MSDKSVMKPLFDLLNEKLKESTNSVILLAVEIDKDGYPITQSCRVSGSPATSLSGLTIIKKLVEQQMEKVLNTLEEVGDLSSKLEDMIQKLGFDDIDDPRFISFLDTSEQGRELKKLIKQVKNQFGK